jgi:peptidoglycan/xylan/chitin deacetylase (PgdA/CDA1 family)
MIIERPGGSAMTKDKRTVRPRALVCVATVLLCLTASSCYGGPEVPVSNLWGRTSTPGGTLNVRSCASSSCSIVRTVPHGSLLPLTATTGDWFRTTYGGSSGWVSSWYIVLQGTPAISLARGNVNRRMVSLTFDAGSDQGYAGPILDFLRDQRIKASFGITGRWADANPAYVRRMANEGHHIFNHTWSHDSLTGFSTGRTQMSPARRTEELVRTNNIIKTLTGQETKPYFRPPYGDYDNGVLRDIGANGYSKNLMWSIDSLGWRGLTAAQICTRVVGAVDADGYRGNGYIILFHVGSQSQDANALPCIVYSLTARGFTFGTVPQVIAP